MSTNLPDDAKRAAWLVPETGGRPGCLFLTANEWAFLGLMCHERSSSLSERYGNLREGHGSQIDGD